LQKGPVSGMSNSGIKNFIKKIHMQQLADYRKELWQKPQLISLFLELTQMCNENCRHCGSDCNTREIDGLLSLEEIKDILITVKEDFNEKLPMLCITGGELLLRKDFFEIMKVANELGFRWGMTSNGTLIDESAALKLKECGMRTISISLDGLRDTHDWFRQTDGGYDRAVRGIKALVANGGFSHVQVTSVIHHRNINELDMMYEEFKKLQIKSWRVINIEPIGRAKDNKELMLSDDEYVKMLDFINKKRFEDPSFEVTFGCSHYLGVPYERELRKWYFLCNAGIYTASIMANGNVGACLDIERNDITIQGNVRDTRFSEIWQNRFEIFRSDYRKCGKCADCKEYEFCTGDSFHTWDFKNMQPNICTRDILRNMKK